MLYGRHTFRFNDTPRGKWYYHWLTNSYCNECNDPETHCLNCQDRQSSYRDDNYGPYHDGRHYDIDYPYFLRSEIKNGPCTHVVNAPLSNVLFLSRWLSEIGEKNRFKIRHLQLCLSHAQTIRCVREKRFNEPNPVRIPNIKGIKRLEWVNTADDILPPSPDPECIETVDSARDELRKLKEDMESGYNTRAYVECSVPFTKKAVDQVDKAIRCHNLVSRMSTWNLPGRSPRASPCRYAAVWRNGRWDKAQ
ncbi:hypothetical protein N7G274_002920 [Stereocaulon virgatum]|uniref:Uncharacterized protein n=1 Tax=Stereocaulon virgatum TaxID=373712 RepID=A0ABR4AFJ2_9LECA